MSLDEEMLPQTLMELYAMEWVLYSWRQPEASYTEKLCACQRLHLWFRCVRALSVLCFCTIKV